MTSYTIFHLSKVGKFVEIINLALKCIVLTNEFDNKIDSSLLVDLLETDDNENPVIDKFITSTISPFDFPTVWMNIIRSNRKDVLCTNMNHTPTDGSGFKEFVKILSGNYDRLLENLII